MASNHNQGRDQNIAQTGGVINVHNGPLESLLEKLSKYAVFSALHNSEARGPRTGVHEGTREEFIENLGEWIEDPVKSGRVFWVRGGAGVGKSAVAQTICEKYAGGRLAGSYYFSRNDGSRNTIDRFIPTIAYQLAKSHGVHSQLASKMSDILAADPSIMDTDLEEQFKHLICGPCAAVDAELWINIPRLIVIDGLDECMDRDPQTHEIDRKPGKREDQRRLLSILRNATSTQPCLPLHFLIFSRPERPIFTSFRSHTFIPPLEEFDMRELRAQADADIKKYLRHEFAQFPDRHPDACLDKSWPGEKAIEKLILSADGHFVYVVTAVKYVDGDDPILLLPQDRLDVVLHTSQTSLYPDLTPLDQLFQHVLQPFTGLREQILLPILQLIISPHRDANNAPTIKFDNGLRSRNAIAKLLKLDSRQVSAVLSRLHSILDVPDDEHRENVTVLHASLSDFLTDKHRSLHFYIEPLRDRVYFQMLSQCLLPILNDMIQRHDAGKKIFDAINILEFYSVDIWLFVGAVFGIGCSSQQMLPDGYDYTPSKELLFAINEFNVYQYTNMLNDRDYMYCICKSLSNPPILAHFGGMDSWATILFENVPCARELYSQCRKCAKSAPDFSSPYTSRFCSQLSPFLENQRPLFEDGWLVIIPKTCTSVTLSQLALLIAAVYSPLPFSYEHHGDFVEFLKLPQIIEDRESLIPFKSFPQGTNLTELPEGSDICYISCEKGRTLVDRMQKLGRNLGGRFYSEAAGERGIRAFTAGQFTGLDKWNNEISMLLELWPSEEGYFGDSDKDWSSKLDWSFDDEDVVSSPELAIPHTRSEDPEDILDYSREFPWRLKTPRCIRSGFEQSESAEEPAQTDEEANIS